MVVTNQNFNATKPTKIKMSNENFFLRTMADKSDSELQNYIDNKSQFQDAAILAAEWEIEKRNKAGTDTKIIEPQKIEKSEVVKKENVRKDLNITDDPDAPLLYHQKFILIYGVLFSVFAGGILMAMNFKRLGKDQIAWLVVFAALAYSIIQIVTFNQIEARTASLTFPINYLGLYLLEFFFWKKHVSKNLKYRKRNIWTPLMLGIVMTGFFTYMIILGGGV